MPLDPDIEIRIASPADAAGINQLYNQCHGDSRPLTGYHWKYGGFPDCRPVPPGYLAILDQQVIGFYGVMSWQLSALGQIVDVVQPCDVCVDERYRGGELYQAIYDGFQRSQREFGRLAFGFPNAQALHIGTTRMGYQIQCGTGIWQRNGGQLTGDESIPIKLTATPPDSWFPALAEKTAALGITTHRSREFLEWRFRSFPGRPFPFVCFTAGEGPDPAGMMIAQTVPHQIRIYDLITQDASTLRAMLSHLTRVFPYYPLVHGVTDTAPYLSVLQDCGFTRRESGTVVTSILNDRGESTPDAITDRIRQSQEWFCTLTDTDM